MIDAVGFHLGLKRFWKVSDMTSDVIITDMRNDIIITDMFSSLNAFNACAPMHSKQAILECLNHLA